jgi:hypothetical protein
MMKPRNAPRQHWKSLKTMIPGTSQTLTDKIMMISSHELSEASPEDVRQSQRFNSFFVVTETKAGKAEDIYISADWPSAEEFAKRRTLKP